MPIKMNHVEAAPAAGSVTTGLITSLCCGGSLVFASIGLGTFWSALGLSRYIPQAMAAGALCIIAINYFFYRRAAERVCRAGDASLMKLRRSMFLSAFLGLAAMAAGFVFLEWLNHGVINPRRLLAPSAFVPGVSNSHLLYALASFAVLALLWALPFPQGGAGAASPALRWALRGGVFAVSAAMIVFLIVKAMPG